MSDACLPHALPCHAAAAPDQVGQTQPRKDGSQFPSLAMCSNTKQLLVSCKAKFVKQAKQFTPLQGSKADAHVLLDSVCSAAPESALYALACALFRGVEKAGRSKLHLH